MSLLPPTLSLLLGAVALPASPQVYEPAQLSLCNSSADVFRIDSFTVSPDNLHASETVNLTAAGQMSKPFVGGTMEVAVKLGPIRVFHKTYDACERMSSSPYQCPLAAGPTTIPLPLHISKVPVHGKVTATAVLSSADGKEVMCLEIVTKL